MAGSAKRGKRTENLDAIRRSALGIGQRAAERRARLVELLEELEKLRDSGGRVRKGGEAR